MKMRAESDLGRGQWQNVHPKTALTPLNLHEFLGRHYLPIWTERHPLSCLHHTRPSPSEKRVKILGNWHGSSKRTYISSYLSVRGGFFLIDR